MNIFLIGPMASGKTCVGQALAEQLQYQFRDSDAIICSKAGVDIATIFQNEGEAGFRTRETEALRELVQSRNIVLATGGGVVLDNENCQLLKDNGVVIYLSAPLDQRYARLDLSAPRPLLMQGDAYQTMQTLDRQRTPLYEETADYIVDNSSDITLAVDKIINCVNKKI